MDNVAVITCRTTLVLVHYTSNDAIFMIWVVYLIGESASWGEY